MSTSFNEMTGVEIEMNPVEKPEKRQDIWFLKDSPEKSSHLGFSLSQFTNSLFKYDRLPADKNVPSNGNSVRSNKYEWADGIRGIAAFIVLIHHIQCAFFGESANSHPGPIYLLPLELLTRGPQAVHVFFVLSGFVLSVSFLGKIHSAETISKCPDEEEAQSQRMKDVHYSGFLSISSTSFRRFARLFVPCFISGWIAFLSTEILNTHVDCEKLFASGMLKDTNWLKRVCLAKAPDSESTMVWRFIQIVFIKVWDGGSDNPYNKVMWTMHIELAGSAVVMFTLLMIANIRWRYRTTVLVAACMFTFNASAVGTTRYFSSFFSGMLMAQLLTYPPLVDFSLKAWRSNWMGLERLGLERLGLVLQGAFTVLSVYLLSMPSGTSDHHSHYFWIFKVLKPFGLEVVKSGNRIGAFMLMLALGFSPRMQKFFKYQVFRFLGRISFLLYLLHFEILMSVAVPVAYNLAIQNILSYGQARYVAGVVCVLLSLAVGYLATVLIDEPVQRRLRLLEKRFQIVGT